MFRQIPLALAALSSLVVALLSYRFLFLGLPESFPTMTPHIDGARLAFLAHVSAAPVALALGAFQFMPRARSLAPGLHRWSGRVYGAAILLGAVAALGMLATANGGLAAQTGFGLLAVAWIATTAVAVRFAVQRRFADHRRWMIRSYALTFAAVTLRLYLGAMMAAGMDYVDAIGFLAWVSWLPNLAAAEVLVRRTAARPVPA